MVTMDYVSFSRMEPSDSLPALVRVFATHVAQSSASIIGYGPNIRSVYKHIFVRYIVPYRLES